MSFLTSFLGFSDAIGSDMAGESLNRSSIPEVGLGLGLLSTGFVRSVFPVASTSPAATK